jgi:hypothetical protein
MLTYHPKVSLPRPNPSLRLVVMEVGFVLQEALEGWSWYLSAWRRLTLPRAAFAKTFGKAAKSGIKTGGQQHRELKQIQSQNYSTRITRNSFRISI